MRLDRSTLLLGVTVVGCGGSPLTTGDAAPADGSRDAGATDLERRIDELAAPLVDPAGVPNKAVGLLIAVASPSGKATVGLGATSIDGGSQPTGKTIFEIGSVTKVFTGFLFARALARGDVGLGDPIDPYFPPGAPSYRGRSISLLDLATHASGLPRMPSNLHAAPPNPAAGYSVADLEDFMADYPLDVEPGTTYGYSNLGAGVLGHVLRLRAGAVSLDQLIEDEITAPLGLLDTAIELDDAQRERLAQGYVAGEPAPPNDIGPGLAAGGALRSTGDDLLRFIAAATVGATTDTDAWTRVLEPQRPSGLGQIGLFVIIEERAGTTVYSHSGSTAGFHAQIFFTTEPPTAVVLLANAKNTDKLRALGLAILDELRAP